MSTRCNIIIKDNEDELIFYRHSDGYPDGAMPLLKKFLSWVKDGKIRNNISQAGSIRASHPKVGLKLRKLP